MALNNSEATEKVIAQAIDLSRAWQHHYLGIEHVFAAACRLDGTVSGALARFNISGSQLEEGILTLVLPGDPDPLWEGMPETPRYRRLMKTLAQEEAESCRALRLEPAHIVAAALREGRSVPCRWLASQGVDLLSLRDAVKGRAPAASQESGGVWGAAPQAANGGSSASRPGAGGAPKGGNGKSKTLEEFGRDLTALARQGKMEPVIGRADEIRRVLQTLTRKTKSNPVLIGEAGVGKTAVAYGLAQRIAQGTVPDILKNRRLVELSINSLVAGASHRGEFEQRLKTIMEELTADPSIILFIDEIHQIVGAGESRGGMDAGNILKPALARGDFAVMGATTTDEYRRYIEADPALERRFQPVMVGEPSEEDAFEILKGLRPRYEQHHKVHFSDETLMVAVKMSVRFLPDRNLPDKAIDVIDEAAARVKTRGGSFGNGENSGQEVTPDVISEVLADWTGIPVARVADDEESRLLNMEELLKGRVVGQDHAVAAVASTIRVVRVGLSSPNRPAGVFLFLGPSGVGKTELAKTLAEYLFGSDREMVRLDMSEFHDKHSVARLIGAPPGYVGYEGEGQLTKAIRTKPFCVLLLDEVEKAHPDIFDIFLQVFDEGRLTDAKGRTLNFTNAIIIMTSNLGARLAYQAEAAAVQAEAAEDGEAGTNTEKAPNVPVPDFDTGVVGQLDTLPEAYQTALRNHFRPEFINRIDEIVVFRRLKREDLRGIVAIHLKKSIDRIKENRQVELEVKPQAVELLLDKGYHPEFGARPLTRAIDTYLTRPMAEYLLRSHITPGTRIFVDSDGEKLTFNTLTARPLSSTMSGTSDGTWSQKPQQPQQVQQGQHPECCPQQERQPLGYQGYPQQNPQPQGYQGYPQQNPQPQGYQGYPQQNQQPQGYQGYPQQNQQPQGYQGYPQQNQQPQGYQGYPQQIQQPQGYQGYPQQERQPQGYQGYPQQNPQPQGYQGYPQQNQQPQGYQGYPQQNQQPQGFQGYPQQNPQPQGYQGYPQQNQQPQGYQGYPQQNQQPQGYQGYPQQNPQPQGYQGYPQQVVPSWNRPAGGQPPFAPEEPQEPSAPNAYPPPVPDSGGPEGGNSPGPFGSHPFGGRTGGF